MKLTSGRNYYSNKVCILFSEETVPQYEEHPFFEHFCVSWEAAHSIADEYKTSDQYKQHFGQYGQHFTFSQFSTYRCSEKILLYIIYLHIILNYTIISGLWYMEI
jgi:hypothetical protein